MELGKRTGAAFPVRRPQVAPSFAPKKKVEEKELEPVPAKRAR